MQDRLKLYFLTFFGFALIWILVWSCMFFATRKLHLPEVYWLVPIFGALGGAVGGVLRSENRLVLCTLEDPASINLGIVGEVATGLGGATAAVFLFAGTLKFDPDKVESYVLLISLSFLAGVFGKRVVEAAGERLLQQARAQAKAVAKKEIRQPASITYTMEAITTTNNGFPTAGLALAERALKLDPNHVGAHLEKGRALKRLGKLQEALAAVEQALKVDQNSARALYNRACYRFLLGTPAAEILPDLEKAFTLMPKLRKDSIRDDDLKELRASDDFQKLQQEPSH